MRQGRGSDTQLAAWREMEWRRCEADPVYFIDTYGHIVSAGRIVKWRLWPIQKQVLRDLSCDVPVVGVKARQLGITTTISHFALWDCLFHEAETWDNISANEDKAKDILKRVQATKDRLPGWMVDRAQGRAALIREGKGSSYGARKDKADSVTKITFGNSEMKIATSTIRSVQGASSNINLDEATLHTDLKRKLQQMQATLDGSKGVGAVIANGAGQDDFFFFYNQAKKGENGFKPYFFWWGDDPTRLAGAIWHQERKHDGDKRIKQSVPVVVPDYDAAPDAYALWRINIMNAAAAGNIEAPWYEEMKKKFLFDNPEADEYAFKAVYPTTEAEAFFISANSRFRVKTVNDYLTDIDTRQPEKIRGFLFVNGEGQTDIEPHGKGRWRVFEPPKGGCTYIMGADSAGGSQAGDYAVIQVLKQLGDGHLEQVAVFQGKCEPQELALECIKAGHWYNDAFVIPEANNTGMVLVDHLKVEYVNIYVRRSRVDKAYFNKPADLLGFWTDKSTKPRLISNLSVWLEEHKLHLNDRATVEELAHYEIKDDGIQTGSPKGMNDDCVMALALAVEGEIDRSSFFVTAEPRSLMTWEE